MLQVVLRCIMRVPVVCCSQATCRQASLGRHGFTALAVQELQCRGCAGDLASSCVNGCMRDHVLSRPAAVLLEVLRSFLFSQCCMLLPSVHQVSSWHSHSPAREKPCIHNTQKQHGINASLSRLSALLLLHVLCQIVVLLVVAHQQQEQ